MENDLLNSKQRQLVPALDASTNPSDQYEHGQWRRAWPLAPAKFRPRPKIGRTLKATPMRYRCLLIRGEDCLRQPVQDEMLRVVAEILRVVA